jgi:hypothetical protein
MLKKHLKTVFITSALCILTAVTVVAASYCGSSLSPRPYICSASSYTSTTESVPSSGKLFVGLNAAVYRSGTCVDFCILNNGPYMAANVNYNRNFSSTDYQNLWRIEADHLVYTVDWLGRQTTYLYTTTSDQR